jgi:nucleotide-binding universal stress UspA family protein
MNTKLNNKISRRAPGKGLGPNTEVVERQSCLSETNKIGAPRTPQQDVVNKILVPTNFTHCAERALEKALALAEQCKASITLLHVVDLSVHALKCWGPVDPAKLELELSRQAMERFAQLVSGLPNKDLDVKTLVREGLPYEEIVAAARDYDLVVLGKSQKPFWHIFSRRTVKGVLEAPPCRILVVSHGKAEWMNRTKGQDGTQDPVAGGHYPIENGRSGNNCDNVILGSTEGHV